MPSIEHEALVNLFRDKPALAPLVLDSLLGVALPPHASVASRDAILDQLAPTEFFADLVVELVRADGTPATAVVVEVQLSAADEKRYTWPVYLATLRARRRCPACVLVVAPDPAVAAWARAPIDLGPGNAGFGVLVLGPAQIPVVRDLEQARAMPEVAVMSALAHGNDEFVGRDVVQAALAGIDGFETKAGEIYCKTIWKHLRGAMRESFEALVREAEARGELETPPVFKELEARGEVRGKAEGKAESLLSVMSARGLEVTEQLRERVLACTDLETLDRWIRRAVTAPTLDDVFE
jgi:hypothetical protein